MPTASARFHGADFHGCPTLSKIRRTAQFASNSEIGIERHHAMMHRGISGAPTHSENPKMVASIALNGQVGINPEDPSGGDWLDAGEGLILNCYNSNCSMDSPCSGGDGDCDAPQLRG